MLTQSPPDEQADRPYDCHGQSFEKRTRNQEDHHAGYDLTIFTAINTMCSGPNEAPRNSSAIQSAPKKMSVTLPQASDQ